MNRKELCRLYASQTAAKGRASNLYFEGRVMYSYGAHYPAAVIAGGKVAYVNNDKYSRSTSCQMGAVRDALQAEDYTLVFYSTDKMKIAAREAQA